MKKKLKASIWMSNSPRDNLQKCFGKGRLHTYLFMK